MQGALLALIKNRLKFSDMVPSAIMEHVLKIMTR